MQAGSSSITRAALGSSASLGDLYDARRDDFCGLSIFKKQIPDSAITLRDSHFSDVHLVHSDDFSEKFSKLDVSAELSVSVLGGLFSLTGSGRYLSDQKRSARTVKSSLIYNIKTKEESVNIYHEDLRDAFAIDAIESGVATHVVVGISWGANSIVSCLYENRDNRDIKEIGGSLSATLNKMSLSISGKASVEFNEGDNTKGIKFDVRMFGDILASNEQLPTTFEGALELIKKLPTLVATSNEGRGKPLTYRLIPLSLLQSYLNFAIKADATLRSLEEASLVRVVQLFEQMSAAQQKLHDFYEDAIEFKYCVRPEDITKISDLKDMMAVEETSFRSKLATVLKNVRSGQSDVSDLEDLLKSFQSSDVSPQKVSALLETWAELIEKINFARTLVQSDAKYIGLGVSLDDELLKNFEDKSYLLYFTQNSKSQDPGQWKGNRQLFFQQIKKKDDGYGYYAVDCDIHPDLMIADHTSCVQIVQAGQVIVEDLLQEQEKSQEMPLAKAISGTERILYKPSKRIELVIPCIGNNCDPNTTYEWTCAKCRQVLEYGFDQQVYCRCGKTPVTLLEFKCTDPKHGLSFDRHEDDFLLQLVNTLRPFPEMNILILGETGVGKSTWINGFINYLKHGTLEAAEKGQLYTLIPSEFTVCDEDYNEILVNTGTDPNEHFKSGQSATQDTKVYPFNIGNSTIRIIDTPGIGDTRGIEQDQKNFENILGTLSNLDELHGICILLKPNQARLNVMFRFCIKELLTYLHRDASQNIVFCFTNCRGTGYRPGDTLQALRALLKENQDVEIPVSKNTIYCFDSEPYRYLAGVKNPGNPVKYPDSERQNVEISWNKSMEDTVRMLEFMKSLPPHAMKSTLSLNHARQLILKMSQPLSEITKRNEEIRSAVEAELKEIEQTKEDIEDLKTKQMIFRTEDEIRKLSRPHMVRNHNSTPCVRNMDDLQEQIFRAMENPGYVPLHIRLAHSRCPICLMDIHDHKLVYYETSRVARRVENKAVTEAIHKNISAAELKQKMIEDKSKELEEYELELKKIQDASLYFAYFLKKFAITPYNDAMEQYLDHMIREEENKNDKGEESQAKLENMKRMKENYVAQRETLEQAMDEGEASGDGATPEKVQMLVDELQKLKHSGKQLRDALDCMEYASSVAYHETKVSNQSRYNSGDEEVAGNGITSLFE